MTVQGIDEDWSKSNPAQLYADGYRFAIGYVSQDTTGKNLTPANVTALHDAGLAVGIVYEYNPQSALKGSGQGLYDAGIAVRGAQALSAPAGTRLYFAVDFDVQSAQLAAVGSYLLAAQTVCEENGYTIGAYGGYRLCHYLASLSLNIALWQTYAWSGGVWEPSAVVRQIQNGIHEAGATVDHDDSTDMQMAGFWLSGVSSTPPPSTSGDDMLTHWTTISKGTSNVAETKVWQGILIAHGYGVGSGNGLPDGSFGPTTDSSTRALQSHYGISVDGEVGPHTLSCGLYGHDYG